MRIHFHSLAHPKRAAKALAKYFAKEAAAGDFETLVPLSEAQRLIAEMLGYKDWHELAQVTSRKEHPPSPYDEDAPKDLVRERLDQYRRVLKASFPSSPSAELDKFILIGRPTSGLKSGSVDPRTRNVVVRDTDADLYESGEAGEWQFLPSLRSDETSEDVYELLEIENTPEGMLARVEGFKLILAGIPEHTQASAALICDLYEMGDYEDAVAAAKHALKHIASGFPPDFPTSGPAPFDWYDLPHRSLLRVYLWAGEAMAKTRDPEALKVVEDLVRFDFRGMLEGKALLRKLKKRKAWSRPTTEEPIRPSS